MPEVVIISTHEALNELILEICNECNYTLHEFNSWDHANQFLALKSENIDVMLIEQDLSTEAKGLHLLQHAHNNFLNIPIIFLINSTDLSMRVEALRAGAKRYVLTPFSKDEISYLIESTISETDFLWDIKLELENLRSAYESGLLVVPVRPVDGEMIRTALKQALELAQCYWVSLVLFDEKPDPYFFAKYGINKDYTINVIRQKGHSFQIINTGRPVIIHDVFADNQIQEKVNRITLETHTRAVLGLLISYEYRRMGVMWFHYKTPQTFSEPEIKRLQDFVNNFGYSYYPTYAEYQLEAYQKNVHRRTLIFDALLRASQAIITRDTFEATLQEIAQQAFTIIQLDSEEEDPEHNFFAALSIIKQKTDSKVLQVITTYPKHIKDIFIENNTHIIDLTLPNPVGLSGQVAISGQYIVEGESPKNPAYIPVPRGFISHLSFPIQIRDETIGVLTLEAKRTNAFSVTDVATIRFIAGLAASAIKITLQANDREQFIQDVTHQLVGPLGGIRAWAEYLIAVNMISDLRKSYLKLLYNQAGRVQRYALNFAYAANENDGQLEKVFSAGAEWITRDRLIRFLIENAQTFQGEARSRNIKGPDVKEDSFSIFPNLYLQMDLFEILILNLYDNAVKYSYDGQSIKVLGRVEEKHVEIEFQNYGVPLSAEDIDLVFKRRSRTEAAIAFAPTGTGVGLYISRRIVKVHGGALIAVPSQTTNKLTGNKVRMIIRLPIKPFINTGR